MNAVPEPVTFLEDMYNPILVENDQQPLGARQDKTESPVRHNDHHCTDFPIIPETKDLSHLVCGTT